MRKLVYILIILLFGVNSFAQGNIISVKKKKTETSKVKKLDGFYYSQPLMLEYKTPLGTTSHKEGRYYMAVEYSKVYIFKSKQKPNKAFQKFLTNRSKMIEESGELERDGQSIYLTTASISNGNKRTYRYVGEIDKDFIYIDYKAAYRQKMAMDLYLYKYE